MWLSVVEYRELSIYIHSSKQIWLLTKIYIGTIDKLNRNGSDKNIDRLNMNWVW